MPHVSIIADDLTGAADTGAPFARARLVTLITTVAGPVSHAEQCPQADVLVLSTESRHLAREQAESRIRHAAEMVADSVWIYKKIDSTLRGHPGPELVRLMEALGLEQALVAPAFPAQGRTTMGGRQLMDGVSLERTPFGAEGVSSELWRVFGSSEDRALSSGKPVRLIGLSTVRRGETAVREALHAAEAAVVIADAETETDLATLAEAAVRGKVRLMCGSAGLARALVRALPLSPIAPPPEPPCLGGGPVLTVAGSRHPQTLRQVDAAWQQGIAVVCPDQEFLASHGEAIETSADQVASRLVARRNVILATAGLDEASMGSQALAIGLARVVRKVATGGRVGGLVLTGGEIAAAVCAELGASALWLLDEVRPGIASSVMLDGLLAGLPVVTKAGGFGAPDALIAATDHLAGRQTARSPAP